MKEYRKWTTDGLKERMILIDQYLHDFHKELDLWYNPPELSEEEAEIDYYWEAYTQMWGSSVGDPIKNLEDDIEELTSEWYLIEEEFYNRGIDDLTEFNPKKILY